MRLKTLSVLGVTALAASAATAVILRGGSAFGAPPPNQPQPGAQGGQGGGQEEDCPDIEEGDPDYDCEPCDGDGYPEIGPIYFLEIPLDPTTTTDVHVLYFYDAAAFEAAARSLYPKLFAPAKPSPGAGNLGNSQGQPHNDLIPAPSGSMGNGSVKLRTGEFSWHIPFPFDPIPCPGPQVSFRRSS